MFLSDIAQVKTNFPEADFWLIRKGTPGRIGEPIKEFHPERIGIFVTHTDIVIPSYLYYMFIHLWRQQYWCQHGRGTLALCHITTRQVMEIQLAEPEPS